MSSTPEKHILDGVRNYLEGAGIPQGASLLVAVSGGPDSVALLRALHAVSPETGLRLSCCHYDHRLRGAEETRTEREFVRNLAHSLGISFHTEAAPPGGIEKTARTEGIGVEAAARRHRYDFFRRIMGKTGADYLALGHTRDDQDETVIMRVCRGAGFSGLKGIPAGGDTLLRPLIRRTREEITGYLEEIGQSSVTDPTNEECRFLRNTVRNRIMPLLHETFSGLSTALDRFREKAALAEDYLAEEADRRIPWTRQGGGYAADWDRFVEAPPILRLYALYGVYDMLTADEGPGGRESELPYRFVRPLVLLEDSMEKGRVPRPDPPVTLLARGHGVVFEIRGASGPARAADPAGPVSGTAEPAVSADAAGAAGTDAAGTAPEYGTAEAAADPGTALRLIARSDVAKATKKGYCVVLEDNFPFNSELLGLQIDKTLVSSKKGVCPRIDFEGLERPILVRSARPGDTIQLKEGKKRVRKLFQEWKIRSEDAWRVPILEDRGGVKAVLGSFAAGADRFAADTPSPNPKHSKTQLVFSKCGVNRSEFSE